MLLYLHYKEISVLEVGKGEEIQNQGLRKMGAGVKYILLKNQEKEQGWVQGWVLLLNSGIAN